LVLKAMVIAEMSAFCGGIAVLLSIGWHFLPNVMRFVRIRHKKADSAGFHHLAHHRPHGSFRLRS
jgi:hypothetical protein